MFDVNIHQRRILNLKIYLYLVSKEKPRLGKRFSYQAYYNLFDSGKKILKLFECLWSCQLIFMAVFR